MVSASLVAKAGLMAVALSVVPVGTAASAASPATRGTATGGATARTRAEVTISGPAGITLNPGLILGTIFRPDIWPKPRDHNRPSLGVASLSGTPGCDAQFTVAGDPGQQVSLSIPGAIRMRRDKDGNEVSVPTRPDCERPQPRALSTATIGADGNLSFAVGGLDAPPTQQGAWRGMLHVTAQYN